MRAAVVVGDDGAAAQASLVGNATINNPSLFCAV
jgi:hypothetical protein